MFYTSLYSQGTKILRFLFHFKLYPYEFIYTYLTDRFIGCSGQGLPVTKKTRLSYYLRLPYNGIIFTLCYCAAYCTLLLMLTQFHCHYIHCSIIRTAPQNTISSYVMITILNQLRHLSVFSKTFK